MLEYNTAYYMLHSMHCVLPTTLCKKYVKLFSRYFLCETVVVYRVKF